MTTKPDKTFWSDMARCRNCSTRLNHREVFTWVNSGIASLECRNCGREIATSASLVLVYVLAALPLVVALIYIHEITQYIHRSGLEIPEILVVLLLVLLQAALAYVMAYVLASRYA